MFRSIVNQKFYTAINVLCLTVGIAFALLIGAFIIGELEVNKSLKDVDRLFFLQNKIEGQTSNIEFFTPPILSKMASEQYPNMFEDYFRFWERNITISKADKHFRLQCMMGDKSFLNIFGFTVMHGDAKTALDKPDCIIITESIARQFFDRVDVVNETLSISTELKGIKEYKITAVIEEPDDKNTVTDIMNMNAQIFMPLENANDFLEGSNPDQWQDRIIAYLKLTSQSTKDEAQSTLNKIVQDNAPKEVSENRTITISPLNDYYLLTNHGAVMKLIISLSIIVLFILILAVTNFINIAIASSFARLKEVGIRKVIGGMRRQLVTQFLLESLTLSCISGLLSLGLYQILFLLFNGLLNANLPSAVDFKPEFWAWIGFGIILIGLLAGIYPALFQSASRPIESLKGRSRSVQGTISFSRVLIAVQFIITVFIFIGAIVLSKQTTYFLERDLGYNESHVLTVYSVPRIWSQEGFQKMDAARDAFLESSKVRAVSLSWGSPAWGIGGYESMIYK
jgi:putative ABC transport system permease protein